MDAMEICWWCLFSLNFIFYGITCIMIIKRKIYTSISMRSPTLLLMSILGNFFIIQIIILYKIFPKNIISHFYFFFRVMMVLSLILRYQRILKCCQIYNNNERDDEKYFSKYRYLYQEKYYFKILAICLLALAAISVILYLINIDYVEGFFRFNLIYDFEEESKNVIFKMNIILWICWNFLEQAILLFYVFQILSKYLKEQLKLEIVLSFILWYIYGAVLTFLSLYFKDYSLDKQHYLNIFLNVFSLIIHYSFLFINGVFPIVLSYHYRTSISYHFNPKLMGNLYLFLTNEECYNTFYDYLKKANDIKGLFYLRLYTHIMKYKLNFSLNSVDKVEALKDLNEIYNSYFSEENYNDIFIDKPIVIKIRKEYQSLNNRILPEIFDEALQFVFIELGKIFDAFHNKIEYSDLYYKIKENSFIHCKFCNTGLINQF